MKMYREIADLNNAWQRRRTLCIRTCPCHCCRREQITSESSSEMASVF